MYIAKNAAEGVEEGALINCIIMRTLDKKRKNTEKVWKDISANEGSVQHLDFLSEEEKEIFKTAPEINQIWVIEHAHHRQDYICQSQSVNLFFSSGSVATNTTNLLNS